MNGTHRRMLLTCVLMLSLAAPAAAGGKGTPAPSDKTSEDQPAQAPVAVRLHFEVLELKLTAEQIDRMNTSTEAVNVETLTAEAIKAGDARVKHVFDAPLILGEGIKLVTGTRVPIMTRSTFTEAGNTMTSISYEHVGCILECVTRWADPRDQGLVAVSCNAEISNMVRDGSVKLSENLAAPVFTTTEQEFGTVVQLGSDVYFSTLWSQRLAPDEKDTRGYVYRLRLTLEHAE